MLKIITIVAALLSSSATGEMIDMDVDVSFKEDHSFTQIMEGNPNDDKINEFVEEITALASKDDVEVEKNTYSYRNMLIFIKAFQGSNQQQHKLLFDTGSGNLWMYGRLCYTCNLDMGYIDERKSKTYRFYPAMYDLHYGSGSIYGYASYDQICMQPNKQCASDFSFITVIGAKIQGGSLPACSGLLGMSPIPYGQSDLFIDQLKKKGTIDQKVFSIYLDFVSKKSKIQFGGFDLKKYAHPQDQKIHWHSLMHKYSWSLVMEGMKLIPGANQNITKENRNNYAAELYGSNSRILIDSGTSFLLFPTDERNSFIDFINQQVNQNVTCNYNVVPVCEYKSIQDFPDLHFKIGSQDVFIPREDYIFPHPYEPIAYVGMISIGNVPIHIMGLNFFKNYYSVFDQENIDNLRIGFALSKSANPRITELMNMVKKEADEKKKDEKKDSKKKEEQLSLEETETLVQGSDITSEDTKEVNFSKTTTYSVISIGVFLVALLFGYKKYNQRKVQNIEGSKDTFTVQ